VLFSQIPSVEIFYIFLTNNFKAKGVGGMLLLQLRSAEDSAATNYQN
jgi:hypothetical protein